MNVMDGKGKKRKMEEVDGDEGQKMEKFFALLRDAREMRDWVMGGVKKSGEGKGERDEGEKPSFQPEDFIEGAANHDQQSKGTQPNLLPGSSKREDEAKEEDKPEGSGSEGLNLKLSL